MNDRSSKQFFRFIILIILTCFSIELLAATSAGDYDYSHRKRDCEITVIAPGGEPFAGTLLGIELLQNDFAFGGTIRYEGFDSIGDEYGAWFSNYFDIATPENEMKWEFAMKCSQKCDPDFSKADSLIAWLSDKKIPVRGNNLFSNEKVERIPEWTRNLGKTEFKQAMLERISTAMEHFKRKVELWDLINEICHGEDGSLLSNNMLETRSGDPNILGWIMDEARKKDTSANFIINDFAIATSSDQAAADKFINKLKPLSSKFQIVGAKGHFSTRMDKNSWEPKINYLAQQLGKPVWLTDLDFSVDINQAPEKMEELMRTCFANPKVTGLTIKSWCGALKTHSNFSSLFIDSLKTETCW
jgi:endo-1,4-beta-xylanase